MIRWYKKRVQIKRLVRELPLILKKMYGKRNSYTEKEIMSAVNKAHYKKAFVEYALAAFMSKSKFTKEREPNRDTDTYDRLRLEIANRYFRGNVKFTIHDLLSNASLSPRRMQTIFDYRTVGAAEIEGASYIIDND